MLRRSIQFRARCKISNCWGWVAAAGFFITNKAVDGYGKRGCTEYNLFASGPAPAGRKRCGTCVGQKKSAGKGAGVGFSMEL